MKIFKKIIIFVSLMLIAIENLAGDGNFEEKGKSFVLFLKEGKFSLAQEMLSEEVKKALENQGIDLQNLWAGLISQIGEYKNIKNIREKEEMGYHSVYITTEFDKGLIDIKVVFGGSEKVEGLFFLPPKIEELSKLPSYANSEAYKEIPLEFGKEDWKLGGTLTVPEGEGPFPLVILVHGSGPQDRDETIGPNKPFRDLAQGLSSKQIAVFRYDKRTKVYPEKISKNLEKFTVKDETIEDALEAVKFLKEKKDLKISKIFILGHSLGATLAPRISLECKDISGLIMLAGVPDGFYINKILEQTNYIFSLDGEISREEEEKLREIKTQLEKIKKLDIKEGEIVLGGSKTYWEDLLKYNPVETLKKLKIPVMILQGERDYQVTLKDFEVWKENLKDKKNFYFKSYPKLNHLFIEGEGKSTPQEYEKAGNVSLEVIEDISNWIKKQK
ncbi:MAG: DUF3887 domain-containing protein [Thermoanaerobaculia bacterium]